MFMTEGPQFIQLRKGQLLDPAPFEQQDRCGVVMRGSVIESCVHKNGTGGTELVTYPHHKGFLVRKPKQASDTYREIRGHRGGSVVALLPADTACEQSRLILDEFLDRIGARDGVRRQYKILRSRMGQRDRTPDQVQREMAELLQSAEWSYVSLWSRGVPEVERHVAHKIHAEFFDLTKEAFSRLTSGIFTVDEYVSIFGFGRSLSNYYSQDQIQEYIEERHAQKYPSQVLCLSSERRKLFEKFLDAPVATRW